MRLQFYRNTMERMQAYNFKRTLLAVILVFLNCVCMASSVVKTSADRNTDVVSLQFCDDLDNLETEPNPVTAYSFKNIQVNVCAARTPAGLRTSYNRSIQFPVQNIAIHRLSACLIPEPAYYSLLFIYSLF